MKDHYLAWKYREIWPPKIHYFGNENCQAWLVQVERDWDVYGIYDDLDLPWQHIYCRHFPYLAHRRVPAHGWHSTESLAPRCWESKQASGAGSGTGHDPTDFGLRNPKRILSLGWSSVDALLRSTQTSQICVRFYFSPLCCCLKSITKTHHWNVICSRGWKIENLKDVKPDPTADQAPHQRALQDQICNSKGWNDLDTCDGTGCDPNDPKPNPAMEE